MEGGRLYPLGMIRPFELKDQRELEAFIRQYFPSAIPGFALLEADAWWGECPVDLVGRDGEGALIALFSTVSREERVFLEVVARALHAAGSFEENKGMLRRVYDKQDLDWDLPLRVILVVPALSGRSRFVRRWLERSGVEVVEYQCYEFEAYEQGKPVILRGISLEAKGEPIGALSQKTSDLRPQTEPTGAWGRGKPQALEARPENGSSVEAFIASLADEHLKALAARLFSFLDSRRPGLEGVVDPAGHRFTLTAEGEHVVTVYLDQGFLWLEVGPERIPTGRITDLGALEKVMKRLELLLDRLGRGRGRTR